MEPLKINIHTISHEAVDVTTCEDKDQQTLYSQSRIGATVHLPMYGAFPSPIPEIEISFKMGFRDKEYNKDEYIYTLLRIVQTLERQIYFHHNYEVNLGIK